MAFAVSEAAVECLNPQIPNFCPISLIMECCGLNLELSPAFASMKWAPDTLCHVIYVLRHIKSILKLEKLTQNNNILFIHQI